MTCATTRERLLACERPDKPGPELSRHLIGCEACQEWLRRLVRLERRIAKRPIEVPPVPAGLFEELEPAAPLVRPFVPPVPSRQEGGRRKAALASALAAALLLFAVGWWALPHLSSGDTATLGGYIARRDARLAKADTAPRRVGALVKLAGEFVAEAKRATPKEAEQLAQYMELCCDDLPTHAEGLRQEEQQVVLDALRGLESDATRLAAEARSARLAQAYERMAVSVRRADQRIRRMLSA
jgi:hypothetical protein